MGFAPLGMWIIDRRQLGTDAWARLARRTSWPGEAPASGGRRLVAPPPPLWPAAGGMLWRLLLLLHGQAIGISPLPP